jgi:hypothetical protein
MTYQAEKQTSWGCLPAIIFGFIFAIPWTTFTLLGECFDENTGRVTGCQSTGWWFLAIVAVTGFLCWLITLAVNRLVRCLVVQRAMPWWGWFVLLGVAAAFAVAIYPWRYF